MFKGYIFAPYNSMFKKYYQRKILSNQLLPITMIMQHYGYSLFSISFDEGVDTSFHIISPKNNEMKTFEKLTREQVAKDDRVKVPQIWKTLYKTSFIIFSIFPSRVQRHGIKPFFLCQCLLICYR